MDAFYASVEEVDDPFLRNKAVIVGGLNPHGIVTAANYEARKYGIHSAMAGFIAREKCPHGYFVRGRRQRYVEVSEKVFDILHSFTDKIEKLSIDEAFLDIEDLKRDPLEIIKKIKEEVYEKTSLTMSVGLSYNKFLAKLASDMNKPDGITIIDKDKAKVILPKLPIGEVYGIGPKNKSKLEAIGIYTVDDMYQLDMDFLENLFGKSGNEIYHRIRGDDDRALEIDRKRKSIGIERTFSADIGSKNVLNKLLKEYSEKLTEELNKKGFKTKTIIVKTKDREFNIQTRSKTLSHYTKSQEEIYEIACELLDEFNLDKELRLMGLTGANLIRDDIEQLSLFNI